MLEGERGSGISTIQRHVSLVFELEFQRKLVVDIVRGSFIEAACGMSESCEKVGQGAVRNMDSTEEFPKLPTDAHSAPLFR